VSAFRTRRITGDFWCSEWSDLCSRTVREWIGWSGTILGLSGRIRQHLRPLWWALYNSGRSDGGLDGPKLCADGPIGLRVNPPFNGDGGDGRPGYESIGIPEYGWGRRNCFGA
jgi:hypothetical protein